MALTAGSAATSLKPAATGGAASAKSATAAEATAAPPAMKPPLPEAIAVGNSGRLFWVSSNFFRGGGRLGHDVHCFSTDHDERFFYEPFFADFGPLNIGRLYRYCEMLKAKLEDPAMAGMRLVHYCSEDARHRPNSAFLICAYQVAMCKMSATAAYRPFRKVYPPFLPFRDATYAICQYHLTVLHCLKALEFGMDLGWYNHETFDIDTYEKYERLENGDLNWVIPNKFAAFSGPVTPSVDRDGFVCSVEQYVEVFRQLGIKSVIRLNKKQYDKKKFTSAGIAHNDLYFVDGSCPSKEIIRQFLEVCEKETGPIAVHCKAGLGRTGTLIGCYAMKNYKFPAQYWIGWNRLCRPGSVLGPQQHFLCEIQSDMMALPSIIEESIRLPASALLRVDTRDDNSLGGMSPEMKKVAEFGDSGQGERLVHARLTASSPKHRTTGVEDTSETPTSVSTTATGTPHSPTTGGQGDDEAPREKEQALPDTTTNLVSTGGDLSPTKASSKKSAKDDDNDWFQLFVPSRSKTVSASSAKAGEGNALTAPTEKPRRTRGITDSSSSAVASQQKSDPTTSSSGVARLYRALTGNGSSTFSTSVPRKTSETNSSQQQTTDTARPASGASESFVARVLGRSSKSASAGPAPPSISPSHSRAGQGAAVTAGFGAPGPSGKAAHSGELRQSGESGKRPSSTPLVDTRLSQDVGGRESNHFRDGRAENNSRGSPSGRVGDSANGSSSSRAKRTQQSVTKGSGAISAVPSEAPSDEVIRRRE